MDWRTTYLQALSIGQMLWLQVSCHGRQRVDGSDSLVICVVIVYPNENTSHLHVVLTGKIGFGCFGAYS
jgi:hypothetical protein